MGDIGPWLWTGTAAVDRNACLHSVFKPRWTPATVKPRSSGTVVWGPVASPTISRSLLEIQVIRSYPRPAEPQSVGWGPRSPSSSPQESAQGSLGATLLLKNVVCGLARQAFLGASPRPTVPESAFSHDPQGVCHQRSQVHLALGPRDTAPLPWLFLSDVQCPILTAWLSI